MKEAKHGIFGEDGIQMEHSTIFSDYVALWVCMLCSCHSLPLFLNGHVFKSQHVSDEEESHVEMKKNPLKASQTNNLADPYQWRAFHVVMQKYHCLSVNDRAALKKSVKLQ